MPEPGSRIRRSGAKRSRPEDDSLAGVGIGSGYALWSPWSAAPGYCAPPAVYSPYGAPPGPSANSTVAASSLLDLAAPTKAGPGAGALAGALAQEGNGKVAGVPAAVDQTPSMRPQPMPQQPIPQPPPPPHATQPHAFWPDTFTGVPHQIPPCGSVCSPYYGASPSAMPPAPPSGHAPPPTMPPYAGAPPPPHALPPPYATPHLSLIHI